MRPPLGLQLNPCKCEWALTCPLPQVALVPTSEVQMLGVPLGSSEFVRGHVAGKLLKTSTEVMAKLVQFDDAQAAMYLLRLSYGIVRANHYMRTTPFSQWKDVAAKFDLCIRDAVAQILGTTFPGDSYAQACISTKFGGLGIRRVADHADVAFAASWHESIRTARESWIVPTLCEAEYVPQMTASAKVDADALDELISHASVRDAQRLRRNDFAHANAWISALPSAMDGKDTVMEPRVYLTAVRRLLGLPVTSVPAPCPLCQQTMDIYGDHAVCCRKSGDMITRHNRVRDLIAEFASKGLLAPDLEKLGLLGPTEKSRRRPGDVSFKRWAPNRGLAIDVAVICPVAVSHVHEEDPCENYARLHKHARYDEGFQSSDYDFVAMVFETSGALNIEGLDVMKQILRCASKNSKMGHSAYCARAWTRISCCIQISVAKMILIRETDDSMGFGANARVNE